MKISLIQFLTSKKGVFASALAAATVAMATRQLLKLNIPMTPEVENLISVIIFAGVGWLIDRIVLRLNATGVEKIQDLLPPSVKSDGVPGEVTIEAVKEAVSNQQL